MTLSRRLLLGAGALLLTSFVAACGRSSKPATAAGTTSASTVATTAPRTSTTSPLASEPCPPEGLACGQGSQLPPKPKPCPAHQTTPTMEGGFCGPDAGPRNGLGPDGECTGKETKLPCAAGVVVGKYYAYTLPGHVNGLAFFAGRWWRSELPPPTEVPDMHVWMRLDSPTSASFISRAGAVAFRPAAV